MNIVDITKASDDELTYLGETLENPYSHHTDEFERESNLIEYLGIGSIFALQVAGRLSETCEDGRTLGQLLCYDLLTMPGIPSPHFIARSIAENPKTDLTARAIPIGFLGETNRTLRSQFGMVMPIQALAACVGYKNEDRPLSRLLGAIDKVFGFPPSTNKADYSALAETIIRRTPRTLPGIGTSNHYTSAEEIARANGNYLFLSALKNVPSASPMG